MIAIEAQEPFMVAEGGVGLDVVFGKSLEWFWTAHGLWMHDASSVVGFRCRVTVITVLSGPYFKDCPPIGVIGVGSGCA